MQDIIEQTPSEQDEQIYAAWESGKTLRVCARQFGVSVVEVERAIDRCLPVFNSQTQMRAYSGKFKSWKTSARSTTRRRWVTTLTAPTSTRG
jgi:hypothetical protein